jgi:hypothetical protein
MKVFFCEGLRMPAHHRRSHVHWGRRPEASREGTRGMVGHRGCRAHLWGFGRFGSGAGSAPMRPSPMNGIVGGAERGVKVVAELARRRRSMLPSRVARPVRAGTIVAGTGPATVMSNNAAARWGDRSHEVSIRITMFGDADQSLGERPRSNRSMMIMRPPQQGQGCARLGGASASVGSAAAARADPAGS